MNITHDHEEQRFKKSVSKVEVLDIIKSNFDNALLSLKLRNEREQTIVGNLLTTLELELKKEIKALEER